MNSDAAGYSLRADRPPPPPVPRKCARISENTETAAVNSMWGEKGKMKKREREREKLTRIISYIFECSARRYFARH